MKSLLMKMLQFNPEKRMQASDLLSDEFFADIRAPSQELTLNRINLSIDFDQKKQEIDFYRDVETLESYRHKILKVSKNLEVNQTKKLNNSY